MLEIVSLETRPIQIGLKDTFRTAVRSADVSNTVILSLLLKNGIVGYGEAVPLQYISGETIESAARAAEITGQLLYGESVSSFRKLILHINDVLKGQLAARAGIEMAIIDAFAKSVELPIWQMFGGNIRGFTTDITIPISEPEHAAESAAKAAAQGFDLLKLKVNGEEDHERLAQVAKAAPEASFILDANQAFNPRAAIEFLEGLPFDLERVKVFEQPVKADDWNGLKFVKENSPVPVYADESAKTPNDAFRLVSMEAVNGINVKIQKSGILGAMDIAAICKAAGVGLMLGCMLESAIGQSASAHLACGIGGFDYIDLDADLLTGGNCGKAGFVRNKNLVNILDQAGFGAEPPER